MTHSEPRIGSGRVHPARVQWLKEGAPVARARYVLYWIQINQRAAMNDALTFAIRQADALGLPLVAYQGLRPDYPGANDRIHTFILEGACDLRRALAEKRILYLFHLERRPSAASGLLAALAREAALIVTEHVVTVPVHAPPQPMKAAPDAGVAVSVTGVPVAKSSLQSVAPLPQLIPVADTVPLPATLTVSIWLLPPPPPPTVNPPPTAL